MGTVKFKLVCAAAMLGLGGCASAPPAPNLVPTIVEVARYIAYECGVPPALVHLSLLDVEWEVLPDAEGVQRFTLTPDEYENLGNNVTELLVRTKQLIAQRDFYEECIEESIARTPEN